MNDAASRGLIGPSLTFSNLVDGANITNILYVAQSVTAQITGNVHATNSSPVTFVDVFANITVNGTNYMTSGQTDGSGNYSLGVFNGTWSLGVSGNDLYNRGFETPTNQNVTISGGNGTANFTLYPIQPLQFTTATLPTGVVSQNYHNYIQATGGQQPYNWTIVSGSLPQNVIFNSGLLDGIPTTSGTFNFNVQITDQQGSTTNKSFSLTINPGLLITTGSLPNGTNGQSYSASLTASGGASPYTWFTTGPLPAGVNLSSNGVFSGTATVSGTAFFTVVVNDSFGNSTNKNLSITINSSGAIPSPSFISLGRNPNGNFEMFLQGQNGHSYRFEGSTTLISTNWIALQTSSPNPTNGVVYFQDSGSTSFNYRFYRAVALP
ncbi:MAG: peptidase and in, kexin, sedolisin [Verrucomicrobiales bacterium]|nr:peptidase and in, kexin, sedolisin [Verrucomicrobiales bacterium]